MPKSESRELSGAIEISSSWEESSSGHVENESSVWLVTEDTKIVLKEKRNLRNFYKSNLSRRTETCYEIEVEKLLHLIKEHGKLQSSGGNQIADLSGSQP